MRHTVFICRNDQLTELLDAIQRELEERGVEVIRGPEPRSGEKLLYPPSSYAELFSRAEVMMMSSRSIGSRDVMLAAPRLRGIVNPAIGLETVDLAAANELGIIVGHGATSENITSMAEATVMLMLTLKYQLQRSESVLRGELQRPAQNRVWAQMLQGSTIGLVGLGRIARATAEMLRGFGVNIVAYSNRSDSEPPHGVRLVDLHTLMRESDIVSVHVSITGESTGLIGPAELSLMKPSAYLINTARGQAIDEVSLYLALKHHRIAGAALDTFLLEPLPAESPLRQLDNVILTPHMVGHTRNGFDSLVSAAIENITRILDGEPPLYCKNPELIPRWRERIASLT